MQTQLKRLLFLTCFLSIMACSDSSDKKDTSEPVDPDALSSIKGRITLAANILPDSDLNDPNTAFSDNSSFSSAQAIDNFVTIQGFATKVNTQTFADENSTLDERKGDRFYASTDEYDFYIVQLQAGQTIQLQTVDSNNYTSNEGFSGDLDVYLYDYLYELIAFSDNLTEFDSLTVPNNGLYYISVHAFAGASKYALKLTSSTGTSSASSSTLDFVPNELIIKRSENTITSARSAALANIYTSHSNPKRHSLAKFSDTIASASHSSALPSALRELASLNQASYEKLMTIQKRKVLQGLPQIESASLNYRRYPLKTPSDTYYNKQWHYPAMNLPQAWNITTGTPETGEVIVAVVDTGIFSAHLDLNNKLVPGYDFISDPSNSLDNEAGTTVSDIDNNPEDPGDGNNISSSSWHGTHVAGTIAAESDNNYGTAGVSWGAKIMPLRALGILGGTTYDIMQAVRFAAKLENDSGILPAQKADIINLSLGGDASSAAEQALFTEVFGLDIIVVAAAGNFNSSVSSYPASYDNVISVSALGFNSTRAPYSNYGSNVDIAAPGGDMTRDRNRDGEGDGVLSTVVENSNGRKNSGFSYYQGTSMAAPHVAGMFALMKAIYPDLSTADITTLLESGSLTNDIGTAGRDDFYGYGAANALKAVQAAQALKNGDALPSIPFNMKASPSSLIFSDSIQTELVISNEGSSNANVESINSNVDWLSFTYTDTQTNGLGSYSIEIDKTDLIAGYYWGQLTFNFAAEDPNITIPPLEVSVSVSSSEEELISKVADIIVVLYDSESFDIAYQTTGYLDTESTSGDLLFDFNRIRAGSYYLYAGTDIDYDFYICQFAEACAIYPNIGNISPIDIAYDSSTSIELSALILSSLSSTKLNDDNSNTRPSYEVSVKQKGSLDNDTQKGIQIRSNSQ